MAQFTLSCQVDELELADAHHMLAFCLVHKLGDSLTTLPLPPFLLLMMMVFLKMKTMLKEMMVKCEELGQVGPVHKPGSLASCLGAACHMK